MAESTRLFRGTRLARRHDFISNRLIAISSSTGFKAWKQHIDAFIHVNDIYVT